MVTFRRKLPNESVRAYVRDNIALILQLWREGLSQREIVALLQEQSFSNVSASEVNIQLKNSITEDDLIARMRSRRSINYS